MSSWRRFVTEKYKWRGDKKEGQLKGKDTKALVLDPPTKKYIFY